MCAVSRRTAHIPINALSVALYYALIASVSAVSLMIMTRKNRLNPGVEDRHKQSSTAAGINGDLARLNNKKWQTKN